MSQRKGLITGVVIVVLVAIVAVVGVVLWNNNKDKDQATETTTLQQPAENQAIAYDGVDGKTALELLKSTYQVEVQTYDGVGEFVTSINGQSADDTHFWSFYVNGEMAAVGAGDYQTKSGEKIEWKLDEIK